MKVHIPFYFSLLLLKSFAWLNIIIITYTMVAVRVRAAKEALLYQA